MRRGAKSAKRPLGRRLDGNAKGLPTFGQGRRSAKIGGVQSHQSEALEKRSPLKKTSRIDARGEAVRVEVDLARQVIQVHAADAAGRVR